MSPALQVVEPGPLALVQDLGRVGHLAVGVGRAGAADRAAYLLGGRLVANRLGAPALEATLGGLRVRAQGSVTLCLTGAPAPARVDGRPVPHLAPFVLYDGQELALAVPPQGLRTYLSVRGGLDVPIVLGSASTDTMSGLGPAPVATADVIPVGRATEGYPSLDVAPVPTPGGGVVSLKVLPGPRRDWFAEPERLQQLWVVSASSDRKGIRLDGEPLERDAAHQGVELPSEGMVRGAIQVPPNGQPVVFLNDHPVTGGYPVIGVVGSADVDRAAQLRPGQQVRLRWAR